MYQSHKNNIWEKYQYISALKLYYQEREREREREKKHSHDCNGLGNFNL